MRTGEASDHFDEVQELLNGMIDGFGPAYLYGRIPVDGEAGTMVSATSEAEKRADYAEREAAGMAVFFDGVEPVFRRADAMMYQNKRI